MSALSERKFYKTTFIYEVLSEEQLPGDMDLSAIEYACIHGDCSGQFGETKVEELNGLQAAEALMAQGSDPEFFRLDENGRDLTDDEDDEEDEAEQQRRDEKHGLYGDREDPAN